MEKIEISRFISKDFRVVEAIKVLRTNVLFSDTSLQTMAVTSFSEGEGKSTVIFELAASIAQTGKRVLLLDADLRNSTLARRLRVLGFVDGLSNYLTGQANVADLIYQTDIPGLYILFAGGPIGNPAEALGSKQFQKLISAVKMTFDCTLVDTAPLGQVVDCAVMASCLDGVVILIDAKRNSCKMERRMKHQLEKAGGKVLGAVLNRVDFKDRSNGYGKAYGYGRHEL